MREPSIHITRETLLKLIIKYIGKDLGENDPGLFEYGGLRLDKRVDKIMKEARNYSLDSRSILLNTRKTREKVNKVTKSQIGDANLLADIIYSVRIKLKHVGVTKIKQTDIQWSQIKELVPVINDFCSKFNLKPREGYITFVETGFLLMGKNKRVNYSYCAKWMRDKANIIIDQYESDIIINNDKYKEETQQLHDTYCRKVLDMTGIYNNYLKNNADYVHFYYARELADKLGVDYDTFIEAQFDALSFCNGIPRLEDLGNEKAQQRLTQYLSKNGYTIEEVEEEEPDTSIWESFKR